MWNKQFNAMAPEANQSTMHNLQSNVRNKTYHLHLHKVPNLH
jgi:hypothetical protein